MKLHGTFAPLTTPFAAGGSLELRGLRENIGRYNRTRLAGYVLNGSAGESVFLTWDEVERVWGEAREAAAPEKILIAGTGAEATAETIQHTNRAAALGYHAALVRTPHYYRPQMTPDVEEEHFLRVADAARIPILVYSVPAFTGLAVEASLIARLAQHPNIAGVKESSGAVQLALQIIAAAPARFQTLVGSTKALTASFEGGAVGAILAVACALPELCVELCEASRSGQTERARALQQTLEPFSTLASRRGIPALKYALDCLGYYGGLPRRPLLPLGEPAKKEIETVLAAVAPAASAGR